jgi:hypothetical protein
LRLNTFDAEIPVFAVEKSGVHSADRNSRAHLCTKLLNLVIFLETVHSYLFLLIGGYPPDLISRAALYPSDNVPIMKRSRLLMIATLFLANSAFSQDQFRMFDNFDTKKGVQVIRPDFVPIAAKPQIATASKKRGAKAQADDKPLTAKTASIKMSPTEGLANRMPAPAAHSYNRLVMGSNSGLKGFTTGNSAVDGFIIESSRRYNIDPLLVYATMHQESAFKPRALSHKGASGLMQLMPATARRLGVTDIYDPKQNIEGGVKYLRILLDMFRGDVVLALAGYNAGEGAVMRYGNNVPPFNETREYVRRISARYTAISNGSYERNVKTVNNNVAEKLEKKESRPLTVYEPSPVAIRSADGRMRLVNQ